MSVSAFQQLKATPLLQVELQSFCQSNSRLSTNFNFLKCSLPSMQQRRFFEDSKPGATPQHRGYDLVCQLTNNKLMHSLNGNTTKPICIQLDNLLPTTEAGFRPQPSHNQANSQSYTTQVSPQLLLTGYKAPTLLQDPTIRLSFPPHLLLLTPYKNS